jgi:SAM-dependent MidA family methyltransferase
VDFEVLRRHALSKGLHVWGPVSQREALLALGFRDLDRRAQARQQEAIAARRGIDAMRIYSNRTRANMLVAKGALGDFKVLCIGIGTDSPPRSVRASVW